MYNKTINLNNYYDSDVIKVIKYPDGQTHVELLMYPQIVNINISLDSADKLMLLLQTVDALKRAKTELFKLNIYYYYGARSDKRTENIYGSSIDALITAKLINDLGFYAVNILDLHNTSIGLHINNYYDVQLPQYFDYKNNVLIMPDLGATKKYSDIEAIDIVQCVKNRDNEGKIKLEILNAEKCINKDCIIKDDLIDGGGTFIAIVQELQRKNIKYNSIRLECTHGIFSKGVECLTQYFDEIVVTNSYTKQPAEVLTNPKVTLLNLDTEHNYFFQV